MFQDKVYIILVNYNGWKDTLECLESILKSTYDNYQVIIVDNFSKDNSIDNIKMWAEGKYDDLTPESSELRYLSYPKIQKPISLIMYDTNQALDGGLEELELSVSNKNIKYPIILINSNNNLGFAGGNNLGTKYALKKDDFKYIWYLNNDAVVKIDSLNLLLNKAESTKSKVGMIGSKILYYHSPNIINSIGGKFNKYTGSIKMVGILEEDRGQYNKNNIDIDYISGCSMFVKKDFIVDVGLMSEDYFLYFEEIDWANRGVLKGWSFEYYSDSIIYHKEGKSIGSHAESTKKSDLSDYYQLRSRLIFTKKFYKKYIVLIYVGFLIVIFNRLKRREFIQLKNVFRVLKEILFYKY